MLFAACALLCSCSQMDEPVAPSTKVERVAKKGVLCLPSQEAFASLVDALKAADTYDINDLPKTRTDGVTGNEDFVSLRQSLIDQGLGEFTDEELAEIIADSLVYEPEDSLIVDPYMMAMLDENREVQIGDKIYRFIEQGLLVYDAPSIVIDPIGDPFNRDSLNDFSPGDLILPDDGLNLAVGEMTLVQDTNGNTAELYGVDYGGEDDGEPDDNEYMDNDFVGGDGGGGGGGAPGNAEYVEDIALKLLFGGHCIPENRVKRVIYNDENSKGLGDLFGTNVTVCNYFNSRHRMKLRMYSVNYLIYSATGMTVRMQKKVVCWWRKKAQEFRYGWSAMELKYRFGRKIFTEHPATATTPKYVEIPAALITEFHCLKTDGVLFYIPESKYNTEDNRATLVLQNSFSEISDVVESWKNYGPNQAYLDYPKGVFTVTDDNETLRVMYPQEEEVAYNDGREVVNWDYQWLTGGLQFILNANSDGTFSLKPSSFTPNMGSDILRGSVYAAVKFDDEWRACEILTE